MAPTSAAAILLAMVGMICLAVGVTIVFSGGWAAITIGALCVMYSLILGWRRKTETLLFANTNNN